MAVRNIIILTSSFPYEGGEQFIESEIKFWENSKFDNIYILPNSQKGKMRELPRNIKVVTDITDCKFKFIYIIKALLFSVFYKEVQYLLHENLDKFSWSRYWVALKLCANLVRQHEKLERAINRLHGETLVYSYWNDVTAYSACLLKRQGKVKYVISRAHGADLYKERRKFNYMPLKKFFSFDYDCIFLLSKKALKYYKKNYDGNDKSFDIGRLGVSIPEKIPAYFFSENKIKILSISYCVPVKRIDKIIDALGEYAQNKNIEIAWTHIGGGELLSKLKERAQFLADKNDNFNYNFIGHIANDEVRKVLQDNSYDIFINTSESEGIPVSIMEAMSFGIPAIAPDIGGISDLIQHKKTGYLMSERSDKHEIIQAINYLHQNLKQENLRFDARNWIIKEFNSEKNYLTFIRKVEKLAEL